MKHTKGPWNICYVQGHEKDLMIETNKGSIVADLRRRNSEANAKLIAAAPDLLEACIEFLACGPNAGHNQELIEQVKQAIIKAAGGLV